MSIRYLIGDVFKRMAELENDSVDLILTSPPFLALRSYLPADHPDKSKEIGSEATPAEYIDVLLRLTAEWRRLLAPHGSLVVELGDTYSGSGGAGGDYGDQGWRDGQLTYKQREAVLPKTERGPKLSDRLHNATTGNKNRDKRPGWPLDKSLSLIPESYRWALVYGFNPFRGPDHPSPAGQWRARNVVRWVRPNPPVGALGDKFRPATSELVVACTSKDRWFDLEAVREPFSERTASSWGTSDPSIGQKPYEVTGGKGARMKTIVNTNAGAPPLDWWKISPKGYSGAHYAVFPSELCVKPIKAMCPREVCRTCGQPRRRITGEAEYVRPNGERGPAVKWESGIASGKGAHTSKPDGQRTRQAPTLGWSDCGHADYSAGLVLDPFCGTGTTLAVAHGHGRDAIGIDIDERSAELARDRVGPLFLEIEYA